MYLRILARFQGAKTLSGCEETHGTYQWICGEGEIWHQIANLLAISLLQFYTLRLLKRGLKLRTPYLTEVASDTCLFPALLGVSYLPAVDYSISVLFCFIIISVVF